MQKLVKRTLAFMLVVSLLCGMLVMTASAAGATPESDGSYYYDFTLAGRLEWQPKENVLAPGFGGLSPSAYQLNVINNYYTKGQNSVTVDGVTTVYKHDLNWTFNDVKGNVALTAEESLSGTTAQPVDLYRVGGTHYQVNYETSNKSVYAHEGIHYFYGGNSKNHSTGGWLALTLKAPDVGTYSVSMDHSINWKGAKQASVYLLPGKLDRTQIQAYVDAGTTGKLDKTLDFYTGYVDADAVKDLDANGNPKTASGDRYCIGKTTSLGTVEIDKACEEYTLIVTTDLNSAGTTGVEVADARIYLDGLRLTPAESQPETKSYSFLLNDKYSGDPTALTADQWNTVYADRDWKLLGTTFDGTKKINDTYLQIYGAGGTGAARNYIAMQLKAPKTTGKYSFKLDTYKMQGPVATDAGKANTAHMWMELYIAKLSDVNAAGGYAAYDFAANGIKAEYKPAYNTDAGGKVYSSDILAPGTTTDAFVCELEAYTEYVLYLRKHEGADTTGDATNGNYSPNHAYLNALTVTEVPQNVAAIGEDYNASTKPYNFAANVNNAALKTLYGSFAGQYTDGSETGLDAEGNVTGYLLGVNGANPDFTINDTGYNALNNTAHLQYSNSSTQLYYYHYNATTGTYTFAPNGTMITNQPLKAGLSAKYESFGWDIIGTSVGKGILFSGDYTQFYSIDNDNYVALKLRSPGDGNFEVDLKLFNPQTGATANSHIGLNVYIVEAKDAVCEVDSDLKVTATLPETPDAWYKPVYDDTTAGKANDAPLFKYGTEEAFTFDFTADTDYIVYLQRRTDSKYETKEDTDNSGYIEYAPLNIYLQSITATPTRENYVAPKYLTVNEALDAAAEAGETVKLLSNALETTVEIPEGVTLDLNGYTLTTSNLTTVDGGKLIDSVGTGLLNVLADRVSFGSKEAWAENTLPLYDSANNGYRFFQYELESDPLTESTGENAQKFWFRFVFVGDKKDEAYTLVETRNSGLTLRAKIEHDQGENILPFVNTKGENAVTNDADGFAAAYASFAKGATNPWLYVNVTSTNLSEKLDITPVISVGGVYITGEAISKQ